MAPASKVSAPEGVLGLLGVLGIIFVVLKLVGVIAWSWWWVLAPFWVPLVIAAAIALAVILFLATTKGNPFN